MRVVCVTVDKNCQVAGEAAAACFHKPSTIQFYRSAISPALSVEPSSPRAWSATIHKWEKRRLSGAKNPMCCPEHCDMYDVPIKTLTSFWPPDVFVDFQGDWPGCEQRVPLQGARYQLARRAERVVIPGTSCYLSALQRGSRRKKHGAVVQASMCCRGINQPNRTCSNYSSVYLCQTARSIIVFHRKGQLN